jgi:undecaprenyl-diphosphatase
VLLVLAAALLACLMLFVDPLVGRWATGVCEQRWSLAIREAAIPLGGPLPPLAAMVALLVLARRWRWPQAYRAALLLPVAFVVSGLAGHIIKITVQRPRPFMMAEEWPQETRWQRMWDARFQSFPSGDVTVSGALAMVGFLLVGKRRVGYLLFAVPAYSATARMVAARHYPSDCLAGFMLGLLTAWLLGRYQERRWPLAQRPEAEPPSPPPA